MGKKFIPSGNVAPTDVTPILISNFDKNDENKENRIIKPMMWGMIPPWHKVTFIVLIFVSFILQFCAFVGRLQEKRLNNEQL